MNAKQRKNWEEAKQNALEALNKAAADFQKSPTAKLPLPNSNRMVKQTDASGRRSNGRLSAPTSHGN